MRKIYLLAFCLGLFLLASAQVQHKCEHHACSRAHYHNIEQTSREARDNRSDSIDLIHNHIELTFDYTNKYITGKSVITFKSLVNGNSSIHIDLEGLDITSATIDDQIIITQVTQDSTGYILKNGTAFSGEGQTLVINYEGHPKKELWGGFDWVGDYAYHIGVAFQAIPHSYGRVTFPCFDNFVEKNTYSFKLTCPADKLANASGVLTDESTIGDSLNVYEYTLDQEISSYLVGIHVGPYEVVKQEFQGVERKIPVTYYAKASDTSAMKNSFSNMLHAFNVYEKDFGPYPFDKIGYSLVPFESGAMEHVNNVSFPIPMAQQGSGESTMAHELAHMWWGNQVTTQNAHMMWLNEGFASFCEFVFTEAVYGEKQYFEDVRENQIATVTNAHLLDSGYYAVNNVPLTYTYGRTTYDKGAFVINNLRNFVGNDSLFWDCLAQFLVNNKWGIMTGASMEAHLESYFDADFTDFFNGWIYNEGFPDFRLDYWENGILGISQQLKKAPALFMNTPLDLTFFDAEWNKETHRVYLKEGCGTFDYSDLVDFEPVLISLDVEEKMADAGMSDYKTVTRKGFSSFSYLGFKMRIQNDIDEDSMWIRPILHYAPPTPQEGITLSNTHYWKVEALNLDIVTEGYFEFAYEGRSQSILSHDWDFDLLDAMDDQADLKLYYRKDSRSSWEEVTDAEHNSNSLYGNFRTSNVRIGEYAIGTNQTLTLNNTYINHSSCDVLNVKELIKTGLRIYPNPSSNGMFELDKIADIIKVYDLEGKLLLNLENTNKVILDQKGVYLIEAFQEDKRWIQKLIFN